MFVVLPWFRSTGQVDRLHHDVRLLGALERKRGQDMERLELEKKELLEVLKALKEEHELAKANTCRITALWSYYGGYMCFTLQECSSCNCLYNIITKGMF